MLRLEIQELSIQTNLNVIFLYHFFSYSCHIVIVSETIKSLEENISSNLFGIDLSNIFLDVSSSKTKPMELHKTQKLIQGKGTHK